jgi:hypothetical protein
MDTINFKISFSGKNYEAFILPSLNEEVTVKRYLDSRPLSFIRGLFVKVGDKTYSLTSLFPAAHPRVYLESGGAVVIDEESIAKGHRSGYLRSVNPSIHDQPFGDRQSNIISEEDIQKIVAGLTDYFNIHK